MSDYRVAVVQDGARLHYAIPVAFHRLGMLDRVFCDWFSRPGTLMHATASLVRTVRPVAGRKMLDRWEPGLAEARVISNPLLALHMGRLRRWHRSSFARERHIAEMVSQWVLRRGFGRANAVFAFVRQVSPGLFAGAKARGLYTIGDHAIAPFAVEIAEERLQRERFPEFVGTHAEPLDDAWCELEKQTWPHLDHMTCASDYVRDGLIAQGIAPEKITVNPYPVDATHFPEIRREPRDGPITVGFVGSVNLRKGTPYFFEVARRFDPAKVRFVMIGPVGIASAAAATYRGPVELVGSVPRSEIRQWLARFDIFFFPSTCEGSAGAVAEAMSSALPIVTSPNSGTAVVHGQSGFIHPYDDIDHYAESIRTLAENADMRRQFGIAGRACMLDLGLDAYGRVLSNILTAANIEVSNKG
jgi:glycosyltransferase involved in cell wall biosynthesis